MIGPDLRASAERHFGRRITRAQLLSGGDIGQVVCVELEGGDRIALKTYPGGAASMVQAEARGLRWLADAKCIRVPAVVHLHAGPAEPAFLALEYLESAPRSPTYDEELGRGLAALHQRGAPEFGFSSAGYIGRLAQPNRPHDTWAAFYREERLLPQLRRAVDAGHVSAATQGAVEAVTAQLEGLAGPAEPPARLHGDLWSGNQHVGPQGEPCLIDPAAYGGHREVDLAMMRLFGGFSDRVFDAYAEVYPLAAGHAARVSLYQLYPLLVHVNLFGSTYASALADAAMRAVRQP